MSKFNCVIYGESGVGKTPFCATLEECELTSPCLFLDIEGGSMSIVGKTQPTILRVEKWTGMQKLYDILKKSDWKKLSEHVGEYKEYKSVVVDSGTELQYVCRSTIVLEQSNIRSHDPEIADLNDFLRVQERFRKLYRAFRDLPDINFVMTAGVRELKDDVSGVVKHTPDLQPALMKDILRMTDLVMFMNVVTKDKMTKRTLQCTLSSRALARDRSQKLETLITADKLSWASIAPKVLL